MEKTYVPFVLLMIVMERFFNDRHKDFITWLFWKFFSDWTRERAEEELKMVG